MLVRDGVGMMDFDDALDDFHALATAEIDNLPDVPPIPRKRTDCPFQHGLHPSNAPLIPRLKCDLCKRYVKLNELIYSCRTCDFDVCSKCKENGPPHVENAFGTSIPSEHSHPPQDHRVFVYDIPGLEDETSLIGLNSSYSGSPRLIPRREKEVSSVESNWTSDLMHWASNSSQSKKRDPSIASQRAQEAGYTYSTSKESKRTPQGATPSCSLPSSLPKPPLEMPEVIGVNGLDNENKWCIPTWDYCFAFDISCSDKNGLLKKVQQFTTQIASCGFHSSIFQDKEKRYLFLLVGVLDDVLSLWAEKFEMNLLVDSGDGMRLGIFYVKNQLLKSEEEVQESEMLLNGGSREVWKGLYAVYKPVKDERIYTRYARDENSLSDHDHTHTSFFSTRDRLRLIYSALVEKTTTSLVSGLSGGGLPLHKLLADRKHPLKAMFPIPQLNLLERLKCEWTKSPCIFSNFSRTTHFLREYFGELITIYFVFSHHTLKWLLLPAFLGIDTFAFQLYNGNIDVFGAEVFAGFLCIWLVFFFCFWRRKEWNFRSQFGMLDLKKRVHTDVSQKSPMQAFINGCVFIVFVGVSIFADYFILDFRARQLDKNWDDYTSMSLIGAITAVEIYALQTLYRYVNQFLNRGRNEVTDKVEIARVFAFGFINAFSSCIWVAFFDEVDFKGNISDEVEKERLLRNLRIHIGSLYMTLLVVSVLVDRLPMCGTRFELDESTTSVHSELRKQSYPHMIYKINDLFVHLGFATFFVIALPATPFIALFSIFLHLNSHGTRLLHVFQRSIPCASSGLGIWNMFLDLTCQLAIASNLALIIFRTSRFPSDLWGIPDKITPIPLDHPRIVFFIVAVIFASLLQLLIRFSIPFQPSTVKSRIRRQTAIESALVKHEKEATNTSASKPVFVELTSIPVWSEEAVDAARNVAEDSPRYRFGSLESHDFSDVIE